MVSDWLLAFDGTFPDGKQAEGRPVNPQWTARLVKESVVLVLCLVYGLLLPLNLLLLSLIPLFLFPPDMAHGPDPAHIRYVDFLAAVTALARNPLRTRLGWVLFLAPYPIYQLLRATVWAVKALRAR
jgi:hypothetical protein